MHHRTDEYTTILMNADTKKILAPLFAAFPVELRNVPAAEARAMLTVYAATLSDVPPELLAAAVARQLATAERLPKIAQIRKTCVELQHGTRRAGGEAWGDVIHAMKRYGYTRTPGVDFALDDPLVARAIAALSWPELCRSDNQVADRARFIDLYDELCDGARTGAQIAAGATSPMLPRTHEQKSLGQTIAGLLPSGHDESGDEP